MPFEAEKPHERRRAVEPVEGDSWDEKDLLFLHGPDVLPPRIVKYGVEEYLFLDHHDVGVVDHNLFEAHLIEAHGVLLITVKNVDAARQFDDLSVHSAVTLGAQSVHTLGVVNFPSLVCRNVPDSLFYIHQCLLPVSA